MPEVLYKEPPQRTITFSSKDNEIKVIRVRKKKVKVPPEPTGDVLKCPYCGMEHEVLTMPGTKPSLSFKCDNKVGFAPLFMTKMSQDYIRGLIVGRGAATPLPPPSTVGPGKKQLYVSLLKQLREEVDND